MAEYRGGQVVEQENHVEDGGQVDGTQLEVEEKSRPQKETLPLKKVEQETRVGSIADSD